MTDAPGQLQQPLECRSDAHVALLARPWSFEQPAACAPGGGASSPLCATSEELRSGESPAQAVKAARDSPTSRAETPKTHASTRPTSAAQPTHSLTRLDERSGLGSSETP